MLFCLSVAGMFIQLRVFSPMITCLYFSQVNFLDERGLESAAVMGHSMGGRAAMAAALNAVGKFPLL